MLIDNLLKEHIKIQDLSNIIKSYLTKTYLDILNQKEINNIKELFEYDSDMMIYLINNNIIKIKKNLFEFSAKYGNLENIKWLLENKFPYDSWVFRNAAENGNLNN